MAVIRTPDERFANLPGYDFSPNYVEVGDTRMHYVDAGEGEETVLCLHGEPTWAYLYRKMIPILATKQRVVVPDLVGFGRSDKYTLLDDYTYAMHQEKLTGFVEALDLRRITLICQDWGGLLGLPLAAAQPERFSRLVIMNTGLPIGEEKVKEAFKAWREFARTTPDMPVGMVIQRTLAAGDDVDPAVIAAYDAPFPTAEYKAGAAAFPLLVPISPDDPASGAMREARERLGKWTKPVLVMFSDGDPITRGGDRFFRKLIPSANEEAEVTIEGAGHFLQEDKGEEIAERVNDFIERRVVG